ncbi:hypothetical protein ACN28E_47880 [Archangium lansingense]|uniref:hypothetical protein n=1 Tax=Archangium lansingense TaxID=2995310 RepID=UPI003B76B426
MLAESMLQGFRLLTLSGRELEVSVLPELGGKLQSLRRRDGGSNVLLTPPDFPYRRPVPGAAFEAHDTSGFDECFPTVAACASPDEPERSWPDHGVLWTSAWRWELEGSRLHMEAESGPRSPWRFRRTLELDGPTLRLGYEVENLTDAPRRFLWAAHPLLSVSAGSTLHLPGSVTEVEVEYSAGGRLGPRGSRVPWPGRGEHRLDVVHGPHLGLADKLFAGPLREGWCALHDAARGSRVTFRFDPVELPFLGVWLCQGGWPSSRPGRHFTVALEPCNGMPDALDAAAARGTCVTLEGGGRTQWSLELEVSS